jgi:hypothetical protein
MAFVEAHPKRSDIPHFHVLSLAPAFVVGSHKDNPLKDLAWQTGWGYMATEEEVKGWKAAWYVAKYASKTDPSIPRGFRRCRTSRDWTKIPSVDLPSYMVKSQKEHLAEYLLRVEEGTGVDVDLLYQRYKVACSIHEVIDYDDV